MLSILPAFFYAYVILYSYKNQHNSWWLDVLQTGKYPILLFGNDLHDNLVLWLRASSIEGVALGDSMMWLGSRVTLQQTMAFSTVIQSYSK